MTAPTDATIDTYHIELKPGRDPAERQGIRREAIYRLKLLLKSAAHLGFRARWGSTTPPVELREPEEEYKGTMIRFADGPANEQLLMLRRAPLFLRVTYDTLRFRWGALDQLVDKPASGEAIFVYRRDGEPSYAMIDYTSGGRRRGGKFACASYRLVQPQPDDATMRDTAKWREWCWHQVGKPGHATPGPSGPSVASAS